ncbi:MAG: ketoacyl-ACP synthase III [Halobacteriovoraceae bacterium]|jgi:3-oxoacyl-[acyl-carrier-protein] synthase III|nr:ketoacyl-ACP synthase III [Halobacteriovoraceae bacterium]
MSLQSRMVGVGAFLPPGIVTNEDLGKLMETSDEWIRQRTGIEERRWVAPEVSTSDLALEASKGALEDAGMKAEDIEMIILATLSPDHDFPGTAVFLQEKMGLAEIPTLDIRQQCTGFLYAISVADQYIRCGTYKNILVVGAEVHSKGLDKTTKGRDVSVLFGDGAGAVIMSATEVNDATKDPHLISSSLHTEGKYAKELWLQAPGMANVDTERLTQAVMDEGLHYPQMNGKVVFVHAVKRMSQCLTKVLENTNTSIDDVDVFLFHQANLRINQKVADMMKIPSEKCFNTIQKYGNTTAATIPIGMHDAIKAGVLKPGMLVASAAFGSGFTWAAALWRY